MCKKSERLNKNEKLVSDILREVAVDIKIALQERGFGILIIIFSLSLSIPLLVPPGYTTILSIQFSLNAALVRKEIFSILNTNSCNREDLTCRKKKKKNRKVRETKNTFHFLWIW